MPGTWLWLRSPKPNKDLFALPQRSGATKANLITERIPGPDREGRSPDPWQILPARTPEIPRRVPSKRELNNRTRRDLKLLQRQRNQPTILRLESWSPLRAPNPPPLQPETWAEFFNSWCRFANQPFSDNAPPLIWAKELTFETVDDGNLNDFLDLLFMSNYSGMEEAKIWHTLMSVLHALLWLHRGRTYTDRNWYLSDAVPTPADPNWRPIVHGRIDPEHILYNRKPPGFKRPYGDTKLYVPADCKVLPSIQTALKKSDFPKPTTYYSAPKLTWLKPKRGAEGLIGAKSDIWSIGAVCFRMMGGPFYLGQPHSWFNIPSDQQFADLSSTMYEEDDMAAWDADDLPKEYSPYLRAAVAKLLVIRPRDRPDVEEAILFAREQFVLWRKRVRAAGGMRQDTKWIRGSRYRNRAPERVRTFPVEGDDDYDPDMDPMKGVTDAQLRMLLEQEANGDFD